MRGPVPAAGQGPSGTASVPTVDPKTEAADLLGRASFFAGCTVAELERLIADAHPIVFSPGEVLCQEGEEADACYVIAEGEATVLVDGRLVAERRKSQILGERAPIEGTPRTATVVAKTKMRTYAIGREVLVDLFTRSRNAADTMRAAMGRRYGLTA